MKTAAFLSCLLAAACPAGAQWAANLADNPSFERDDNRDALPDGWTGSGFLSPAKVAWDRTVAHAGAASVRISDSHNPAAKEWNERSGRWVLTARRPATPGKAYSLGLWVRTQSVTGQANACIAWWSGGKWLAESYTPNVSGTAGWKHVSVRATAPDGADGAQVYLCLSASKGTAWFDDVTFVEGDAVPAQVEPVDLRAACGAGFRDEAAGDGKGGWTDQGDNDLRNLPTGRAVFRGVPFEVIDPAANAGRSCVVLKGKGTAHQPASAVVPLGHTCQTLYFLHACAWAPRGASAGRYELVYADGTKAAVALQSGRDVFDWWDPQDRARVAVGWEGGNPQHGPVGLGVFPLANPQPDKAIQEVRAVSAGGDPVLMLVAITTSDGPAVLSPRPVRYEFTDTAGWYEFAFPADDTNLDAIDLTGFLDAPAGKHGFLSVRDNGHFYFADGTRVRFWGTNICGPSAFPAKSDAPALAGRLAKYGVNLLRIHAVDGRWGRLIDYTQGDSRHLNAEALDRLDFFFAELRKRGIYVYFDLLDYRQFVPGDGVADAGKFEHGWRNSIKGATIYNDRLIELQKELATNFLTHTNPYTTLRYVDDPAVAVVEITNENSVFYMHNTSLTLPVYVQELRERWDAWRKDQKLGPAPLPLKQMYQDPAKAPGSGEGSRQNVSEMLRFLFDIERRYYGQMRDHLRRIGLRVPITGTNQTFCPASAYSDSVNDFMSRNNYWQHPNVHAKPFVTFRNVSVLDSDLAATSNPVTEVASSSVAGKPMIVPEYNFPWPNEYRSECLPLMAAYACLQDWDGMLFFAYRPEGRALEHFANQSDPVRWGQFPAAAMLFHRGDVDAARQTVSLSWTEQDVFAGGPTHRQAKGSPFRRVTYEHEVRNLFASAPEPDPTDPASAIRALVIHKGPTWGLTAGAIDPNAPNSRVSDTGQLRLYADRGLFVIAAPRTMAVVGRLGKVGKLTLGDLAVECENAFAAVMVTSLDGQPIGKARRVLVTAVARAENTGQAFTRNHTALAEKGRPPVLVEPVRCELHVPMPGQAVARPLDPTGRRRDAMPTTWQAGRAQFRTDAARSPWIELAVE